MARRLIRRLRVRYLSGAQKTFSWGLSLKNVHPSSLISLSSQPSTWKLCIIISFDDIIVISATAQAAHMSNLHLTRHLSFDIIQVFEVLTGHLKVTGSIPVWGSKTRFYQGVSSTNVHISSVMSPSSHIHITYNIHIRNLLRRTTASTVAWKIAWQNIGNRVCIDALKLIHI